MCNILTIFQIIKHFEKLLYRMASLVAFFFISNISTSKTVTKILNDLSNAIKNLL